MQNWKRPANNRRFSLYMKVCSLLLRRFFQIAAGRVVQHCTSLVESGTVAGAVPCMLGHVPLESAAHVGTSPGCGREKILNSFKTVNKQLGFPHTPGRVENRCVWVFPFRHHIRKHHGRNHR